MNEEFTVVNVYCLYCPYVWEAFKKVEDVRKVVFTGLCPTCFYNRYGTFIKFAEK